MRAKQIKQPTRPHLTKQSSWVPAIVFIALSFALYGNSLSGEFVYDDIPFVSNGALHEVAYLWTIWLQPTLKGIAGFSHYRPLTFFTFSLNFLLTGDSPVWFHAVSITLNGLSSWLLFVLMMKLFGNRPLAWCTALLFALLPIHTESVAYIKARDEILVAFFALLSWITFIKATKNEQMRWTPAALSALFSLCAFFSKESAVVLPGVLGGSLLLLHGRKALVRSAMPLILQALAIAIYFFLRDIAIGSLPQPTAQSVYFGFNPLGWMEPRFIPWTGFMLFFVAVAKTFVPWNLTATYGFAHLLPIDSPFASWMAVPGVIVLLCMMLIIALPQTRRTPFGIGALTFLLLYLPFSKLLLVHGMDYFGERWLFGPSVGLSMIGGYALWLLGNRRKNLAVCLFVVISGAYLTVLIPRNLVWQNMTALGESMVRDAPRSVVAYDILANDRLQKGRTEEAGMLVEQGLTITYNHVPLHHTAAAVALDMNRPDIAEKAIEAAETLGADELYTTLLRSMIFAKQGKFEESLKNIEDSRWFNPFEPRTRFLLALSLWRLGRTDEALFYFDWDAGTPGVKLTPEQKIWVIEHF